MNGANLGSDTREPVRHRKGLNLSTLGSGLAAAFVAVVLPADDSAQAAKARAVRMRALSLGALLVVACLWSLIVLPGKITQARGDAERLLATGCGTTFTHGVATICFDQAAWAAADTSTKSIAVHACLSKIRKPVGEVRIVSRTGTVIDARSNSGMPLL